MRNECTLLANHSSGRLLPSLLSATPNQTERSDEGVKTGQKIAYYFYIMMSFDVKI